MTKKLTPPTERQFEKKLENIRELRKTGYTKILQQELQQVRKLREELEWIKQ